MTVWPLTTAPYEVQLEALRRSEGKKCFGWYMEQGLGKTGVAYADFIRAFMEEKCEIMVVVAPFYLMSEWELEAQKQGVKFPVFTWPNDLPRDQKPPFTYVMNVEAARAGRGFAFLDQLLDKYKAWFGIDESTLIKNFKSLAFTELMKLAQKVTIRRELSGLPMPHDVMDLWPQLRFLEQLSGLNPYAFRNRFAVMGGYMHKQVKGIKNEDQLHKIMDECTFRALKIDWAKSLPPKIYKQRLFDMTKAQKEHYHEMEEDFITLVDKSNPETAVFADQVIHAMIKLQQISRGFIMDGEKVAQELVPVGKNPAINTLKATLDATQGKTLIFTQYRHSTQLLQDVLLDHYKQGVKDTKPRVKMMMGGMDKEEIRASKDEFNNDPDVRAFVLQVAVGHRGHTLLGDVDPKSKNYGPHTLCNNTTFYESNFNYEHRAQGEDRNHRWGAYGDVVTYTDFICSKMDEKFMASFVKRQSLVDAVLNARRAIPK